MSQSPGTQVFKVKTQSGFDLQAVLELPNDTQPKAYALFAHCFTCSKNFRTSAALTKALGAKGFGVVRFDFTGLGESGGDFADSNFTSNVQDLHDVATHMAALNMAPSLLFGHSFGGTAALAAAASIPSVKAVASINSPFEPFHVRHLFCERIDDIEKYGEAEVVLAGRPFTIRRQFVEDIAAQAMEQKLAELNKPLMIFHSPTDTVVDVENARQIYQAAKHPKNYIALDGADHFLRRPEDSDYVGAMLAEWASRYIVA